MTAHTGAHAAATLLTGLNAGVLLAFAIAVLPGLRRAGDVVFVAAMRGVNRAILNGWFLTVFLGAPAVTALAVVLGWRAGEGTPPPWSTAALLLGLVVVGVTAAVNVPLNERLAAEPEAGDAATARERFEPRWRHWHLVRTVAAVAAFGALLAGSPGVAT